jgi:hypothetical protein
VELSPQVVASNVTAATTFLNEAKYDLSKPVGALKIVFTLEAEHGVRSIPRVLDVPQKTLDKASAKFRGRRGSVFKRGGTKADKEMEAATAKARDTSVRTRAASMMMSSAPSPKAWRPFTCSFGLPGSIGIEWEENTRAQMDPGLQLSAEKVVTIKHVRPSTQASAVKDLAANSILRSINGTAVDGIADFDSIVATRAPQTGESRGCLTPLAAAPDPP